MDANYPQVHAQSFSTHLLHVLCNNKSVSAIAERRIMILMTIFSYAISSIMLSFQLCMPSSYLQQPDILSAVVVAIV